MSAVDQKPAGLAEPPPRQRPAKRRPGPVRRAKLFTIWLHRWSALVLGTVLVVITTSGAVVVYHPEVNHWLQDSEYSEPTPGLRDGQPRVTLVDAAALVAADDPDFRWDTLHYSPQHHTIVAESYDTGRRIALDQQTGEVVADFDTTKPTSAPAVNWTMRLMVNVHDCFFSCEGYPGYAAFLTQEVPHTGWLGFDGANISWAGLLLSVAALLLLFTSLSGIWLWWPTVKRFSHGLRVRWKKGRFARDYDLHQVVGMACLPLLLVWGITGANFEMGWVGKAWYAVTPGSEPAGAAVTSQVPKGVTDPPDVSLQQVYDAAAAVVAGRGPITGIENATPVADDPTATYLVYFADGVDPWALSDYPGDTGVLVDRYSGQAQIDPAAQDRTLTSLLWQEWASNVHFGTPVNGWWRILWFLGGMTPLLLMWTGVSTWLYKRSVQRRKKAAHTAPPAPPTPSSPAVVA